MATTTITKLANPQQQNDHHHSIQRKQSIAGSSVISQAQAQVQQAPSIHHSQSSPLLHGRSQVRHRSQSPISATEKKRIDVVEKSNLAGGGSLNLAPVSGHKRKRPQSVVMITRQISVDTSRARSNAPVVRACLEKLGWKDYPNGRDDGKPCDIYWHAFVYPDMRDIVPTGKVNKFPGMADLSKKISLTRALSAMQKLFPDQYDFFPRSWFIPSQLHEFYEDFYAYSLNSSLNGVHSTWFIAKPDDGSQGERIYLIQNPSELQTLDKPQIVQQYITDPYLMQDKLKFDLRIYCVVRSLNPLTVYIAREGMARFCTMQYRLPSAGNAGRTFMHLTNYSLNKKNAEGFVHSKTMTDEKSGSKRLLSSVFHQMEARGVDTRRIWHDIKTIIVKTVLALVPELILRYENQYYGANGPQCFHILGFDILLDKNLKPILLEINACPSLSIGHDDQENNPGGVSVVDEAIKIPLVRDTLLLVMDMLPDQRRSSHAQTSSVNNNNNGQKSITADDLELLPSISGYRSSLSEIFPAQFGYSCAPYLALDKAAYFYMQCVHIRRTTEISMGGCRNFVKKCNLNDVISIEELDSVYAQLCRTLICQSTQGLPFYGFVELLLILAGRKFPKANCLLDALRSLFQYCEAQIRYHGVRSSRLRADAVEHSVNRSVKDFYLLPSRRQQQQQQPQINNNNVNNINNKIIHNNHYNNSPYSTTVAPALKRRSSSGVSLPRIS